MDKASKIARLRAHIKDIDVALSQSESFDIIELSYCLRVLKEVSEKDFKTATNFIFESLQENKERLEKEVQYIGTDI